MTTPYNSDYDPPAPILSVTLSGMVRRRPRVRLPALIDTGADMTVIPDTAVKRLHLYSVGRVEVEGVHVQAKMVDIFTVRLSIDNLAAQEMEVVQTALPFIVLGRDWLENYYLLLNGPEKTFLLSNSPIVESS